MARIVVNKHISSGRAFVTSGDIQNRGEIIIVNEAGDEGILIRNTDDEIVDVTKIVSGALMTLSGSVVDNYATIEYSDEKDDAVLAAANEYTDNASGNIETKINDLEDRIEELTSGSSASYESIINLLHENYWNSATTQDVIGAVSSTTNSQISNLLAIINQERNEREAEDININQNITSINGSIGNINTDIANLSAGTESEIADIKTKLTDVYHFKGSVNTFEDLPTEDVENGDTYNVISGRTVSGTTIPDGTNYAWTGEEWDELGGIFDFSDFVTKGDLATTSGGIINYVDSQISGATGEITTLSASTHNAITSTNTALSGLSGSVQTLSGKVQTICANTIQYIDGKVSDINSDIEDLSDTVETLSSNTETAISALSSATVEYIDDKVSDVEGNLSDLSGSVISFSAAVIDNYATSADTISAVTNALTNANAYTDEKISGVTDSVSELSGSVIALSAGTEEKIDSAITESKEYTNEKIEALSGNVESAITDAVTSGKNYTDSVAEVISTALSAVSGTAVTAIQDIQFAKLESGYTVTYGNVKIKRENNIITIDLSEMDITGNKEYTDYE